MPSTSPTVLATEKLTFFINPGMIGWVLSMKFLEFYFARRGGDRSLFNYLWRKAFKKCNIIKALSNKRYGSRSQHLFTLVQATVSFLTHYGVVILANACDSTFEVIQTSALRTALGLPQWVPNIILRHHAGVPLMAAHIRHLGCNFWVKHLSLRNWSSF